MIVFLTEQGDSNVAGLFVLGFVVMAFAMFWSAYRKAKR